MDLLIELLPLAFFALYALSRIGRKRPAARPAEPSAEPVPVEARPESPGGFSLEELLRRLDEAANPPAPVAPRPVAPRPAPPSGAFERVVAEGPQRARRVEPVAAPPPRPAPAAGIAARLRSPESAREAFIFSTVFARRRPGRR